METTQPNDPTKQKFTPLTPDNLPPELIDEALAIARRYDRNFANKDGTDAIPVPARTCRLLGLAIINLHNQVFGAATAAKAEKGYFAGDKPKPKPAVKKTGKATEKKPVKAKSVKIGPPLSAERRKAYDIIVDVVKNKQVVTTRLIAEKGGWASHNTAARHIKSLIDLGYLKRVGKQGVLALTDQQA